MKKTKAILMALCAVLLVAASVMGTLAYLTSTDSVTNTFTVGKVEITLDEAKANADGTLVEGAARVDANTYKLMPGHEYVKDPIVHVAAGSENCFLFVKVENGIAAIEAEGDTTIAAQMAAKGWDVVDAANGIYVYADAQGKPAAVSAGANVTVFESFTISGDVTNERLDGSIVATGPSGESITAPDYRQAEIVVTAYAVQADGFTGKNAFDIWEAAGF